MEHLHAGFTECKCSESCCIQAQNKILILQAEHTKFELKATSLHM